MDKEKAIKAFEIRIISDSEEFDTVEIPVGEAVQILELLKEQEPKPVELHTNAYGTKFYFCPKCKRELFHTRNLNFCERCGQAVKWNA